MKTIFDLIGKQKQEEVIKFDEYMDFNGRWSNTSMTSKDFKHCVLIAERPKYIFYLCLDDNYNLGDIAIYRKKKNEK